MHTTSTNLPIAEAMNASDRIQRILLLPHPPVVDDPINTAKDVKWSVDELTEYIRSLSPSSVFITLDAGKTQSEPQRTHHLLPNRTYN